MNIKKLLVTFAITFTAALTAAVVGTLLWNFFKYGTAVVQWETAFSLAFTVSFVVAWIKRRIALSKGL